MKNIKEIKLNQTSLLDSQINNNQMLNIRGGDGEVIIVDEKEIKKRSNHVTVILDVIEMQN